MNTTTNETRIEWEQDPGSPNYTSTCRRYVAIYKGTVRGLGSYFVFPYALPVKSRTERNALCVGGLPQFKYWNR